MWTKINSYYSINLDENQFLTLGAKFYDMSVKNRQKGVKMFSTQSMNFGISAESERLFRFANSHLIATRDSESLSCATTPHPSCFS